MMKHLLRGVIMAGLIGAAAVLPAEAQAQYNIKTMTPQVEQALAGRRDRYEALRELKRLGQVGENNRGYVEALENASADAQSMVEAENADRKVIYQTIAEQNDLMDAMLTIEKIFAQVQAENARSGEMLQMADGKWIIK